MVNNLPPTPMKFGFLSVRQYYEKNLKLPNSKFNFSPVSEETILKLLQSIDEDKAAGLDNLSGKFLKDGASILVINLSIAKPISQICNLSS